LRSRNEWTSGVVAGCVSGYAYIHQCPPHSSSVDNTDERKVIRGIPEVQPVRVVPALPAHLRERVQARAARELVAWPAVCEHEQHERQYQHRRHRHPRACRCRCRCGRIGRCGGRRRGRVGHRARRRQGQGAYPGPPRPDSDTARSARQAIRQLCRSPRHWKRLRSMPSKHQVSADINMSGQEESQPYSSSTHPPHPPPHRHHELLQGLCQGCPARGHAYRSV
jgi:hypothetical protein